MTVSSPSAPGHAPGHAPGRAPRSETFPPGFPSQRTKVVQLLKDWKNRYSTGPGTTSDGPPRDSNPDEASDGHWPLNANILSADKYANTMRDLDRSISHMAARTAYYTPLAALFLHEDASDSAYDHLKEQATQTRVDADGEEYPAFPRKRLLLDQVDMAIDLLTMLLMDKVLSVRMPQRHIRVTHRRQTMEENYREYYRIFASWCDTLSTQHKRYRNKAMNNAAIQTRQSRSTIERAVHFVESGEAAADTHYSYQAVHPQRASVAS